MDEPELLTKSLEDDKSIATFAIKKKTDKTPDDGGRSDTETAIMNLSQRKDRCMPISPDRHPSTEVRSGESPTLLQVQDASTFPDALSEADGLPDTPNINQERNDPTATSNTRNSLATMMALVAGTKAAVQGQFAGSHVKANVLPKPTGQNTEAETALKGPDSEDLSQALVKNVKARKEPDGAEGEYVAPQPRMRENLVGQAKEKFTSLFCATAGQLITKEVKIGRMVVTLTTQNGQPISETKADSKLVAVGRKTASKMAATVLSTPVSLETTHEEWLVMHKPDRNAYAAARQTMTEQDIADMSLKLDADRAARRSRLEQEEEEFRSCLTSQSRTLDDLKAETARLKAKISDSEKNLGKSPPRVNEQTAISRRREIKDMERKMWQRQYAARNAVSRHTRIVRMRRKVRLSHDGKW